MGPGPTDVAPRVLEAMARPMIGHLDPEFVALMDRIKIQLQRTFRTENPLTMPISGPGTAGMEACMVNLLAPGDTVVVCQNGVFGGRLKAMATRCGATVVDVKDDWGRAVNPEKLESVLAKTPETSVVAFVHAETSTGALSDAKTLAGIAQDHGCLTVVDTVTSLGGAPLEVDAWGLDAVYSGTQKCLSCTPGLSPVTVSSKALQKVEQRRTAVQSWFMDFTLVTGYWGTATKRSYHHTAPINALYCLHEALLMILAEGLEATWKRHLHHHHALRAGLEVLGIEFVVPPEERIPHLNTVRIPDGVCDERVRSRLLNEFNLEIGAGLGALSGKVWRIGIMGHSSRRENIQLCINALGHILVDEGLHVSASEAVAEVDRVLRDK